MRTSKIPREGKRKRHSKKVRPYQESGVSLLSTPNRLIAKPPFPAKTTSLADKDTGRRNPAFSISGPIAKIETFLEKHRSPLVLSYQIVGSWFLFFSAQFILGRERLLIVPFIACSFMIGIYLLNWISEINADFINDPSRLSVVKNPKLYWMAALIGLGAGLAIPIVAGKVHWSVILLLIVGVLYSFPMTPWWTSKKGWHFARLKQIPVIKSLTVTLTYSSYIFGLPLVFSPVLHGVDPYLPWLIVGYLASSILNTTYDDYLDYQSDVIAGIPTVPILLGKTRYHMAFLAVVGAWSIGVLSGWGTNSLDGKHAGFLLIQSLFPLSWLLIRRYLPNKRFLLDLMIESFLPLTALGYYLISI